ncbi:endonuclease VII domain-containing protein [Streptomyces seoulensis]
MESEGEGKRCVRCGKSKPRAAFARKTYSRGGQDPVCGGHKRCRRCGEVKPHNERHGKGDRLASRLTVAERDAMVDSQRGLCVICLNAPAAHVDHCHKTGRVRGVLCFNCNSAIGKLGDDPEAVRRAAAYLEGNSWKPILVAPGVYQLPS